MDFETLELKSCEDKFQMLGAMEIGFITALIEFSDNCSPDSIKDLYLKIKSIYATSWALFPVAIKAGEGNEDAKKLFERLKKQLKGECEEILDCANDINLKVIKLNKIKETIQ